MKQQEHKSFEDNEDERLMVNINPLEKKGPILEQDSWHEAPMKFWVVQMKMKKFTGGLNPLERSYLGAR